MIKMYKIDYSKNIGTAIFVVEGGKPETGGTELKLLKSIFSDVRHYQVHELRRGCEEFIGYGKNASSRVFALNLPKNQLTQLNEEALDELYKRLASEFSLKPENHPIFFIYDRDYLSYKSNELRGRYVAKYTDPYSNENGDQGQLLLSYPSIESYFLSSIRNDMYKECYYLGKDIKPEVTKVGIDAEKFNDENKIIHAVNEMDSGLAAYGIDEYDLDNLGSTLLQVYDIEQEKVKNDRKFFALSLFSLALLELGIVIEAE